MQPGGKYYGAAAQYNKNGANFGTILKIAGLIVGVIILATLGFIGYNALTSAGKNEAAKLVARQRQLASFVSNNQTEITNGNLQTINSNASALLASDTYALQQALRGLGLSAVPEIIAKEENDNTSAKALANAKVQNNFDQVYLELLREKVAATESLARIVRGNNSGAIKSATEKLLNNLSAIDSQLAKLQL